MPLATASDGVRIHFEEAGTGHPLIFVHEFGGDLRSWEAQVRWFARSYRCIRFNARGYPPSDVPEDEALYGHEQAADDIAAVMGALGLSRAHVVGLSMGGYATLQFGMRHPRLASALVVAGAGSGAPRAHRVDFRAQADALAERLLREGSPAVARDMGLSATRVQLLEKDPLGWAEFVEQFATHSARGSAMTLRRYQALRPSLFDHERELAALAIPTLLVVGDEDEPCLETNLFLKRTMTAADLWVMPGTGHAVNLEEPAAFNDGVERFLAGVDRGSWGPRDPRTIGAAPLPVGSGPTR